MIALVSSRRNRILGHVREFRAQRDYQRDRTFRRRSRLPADSSDLQQVQAYVQVLEQVLDGVEAHRVHLREYSWRYTRSIKTLRHQARGPARQGDYSLADYVGAARVYVHVLETQLRTSNVPHEVLDDVRRFYAAAYANIPPQQPTP